jgi:hypothetical protein
MILFMTKNSCQNVTGGFAGSWNGETVTGLISKHRCFDALRTREMLRNAALMRQPAGFFGERNGERF